MAAPTAASSGLNGRAVPVRIDGQVYPSARQAALAVGLSSNTVVGRCHSPRRPRSAQSRRPRPPSRPKPPRRSRAVSASADSPASCSSTRPATRTPSSRTSSTTGYPARGRRPSLCAGMPTPCARAASTSRNAGSTTRRTWTRSSRPRRCPRSGWSSPRHPTTDAVLPSCTKKGHRRGGPFFSCACARSRPDRGLGGYQSSEVAALPMLAWIRSPSFRSSGLIFSMSDRWFTGPSCAGVTMPDP